MQLVLALVMCTSKSTSPSTAAGSRSSYQCLAEGRYLDTTVDGKLFLRLRPHSAVADAASADTAPLLALALALALVRLQARTSSSARPSATTSINSSTYQYHTGAAPVPALALVPEPVPQLLRALVRVIGARSCARTDASICTRTSFRASALHTHTSRAASASGATSTPRTLVCTIATSTFSLN